MDMRNATRNVGLWNVQHPLPDTFDFLHSVFSLLSEYSDWTNIPLAYSDGK